MLKDADYGKKRLFNQCGGFTTIKETLHENSPKIRGGECSRCGECCRWLIFPVALGGMEFDELYAAHGCKTDPNVGLLVYAPCPHLKRERVAGNVWSCDIYEERPLLCRTKNLTGILRAYVHEGCTQRLT